MAAVPTQIRIDADGKKQASTLFKTLGMDLSGAVNIFLHQCLLCEGLPFKVEMPKYSDEVMAAIEEARKISRDPKVKGYTNMEDLKSALEE